MSTTIVTGETQEAVNRTIQTLMEENGSESRQLIISTDKTRVEKFNDEWPIVIIDHSVGDIVVRIKPDVIVVQNLNELYAHENLHPFFTDDALMRISASGHKVIIGLTTKTQRTQAVLDTASKYQEEITYLNADNH